MLRVKQNMMTLKSFFSFGSVAVLSGALWFQPVGAVAGSPAQTEAQRILAATGVSGG